MRELLIATKNPGKFREIGEVLSGLPLRLLFLRDLALDDSGFEEDGETFLENARKKAEFFAEKSGLLTLGEDSGILIDALAGELGVKTRRWGAGEGANDEEWIEHFLKRMSDEDNRRAEFVCAGVLFGEGVDAFFEGRTVGEITAGLEAPIVEGIPLSSCFRPTGCDKVYAALEVAEKNKVSHRGKAMAQLREFLEGLLAEA